MRCDFHPMPWYNFAMEEACSPLQSVVVDDAEPTNDELEALASDPEAIWKTADEVMARLRELDAQ